MRDVRTVGVKQGAVFALAVSLVFLSAALKAAEANYGQFGPYDYYKPPRGALSLVERAHMGTIIAEAKHRGLWCVYYENIDYTLRAFPNHPEALTLMADYLSARAPCGRGGGEAAPRGRSPLELATAIEAGAWRARDADYYFEKGIGYKPKDSPTSVVNRPETRVLYGKYLYSQKRLDDALKQFTEAAKLEPSSAESHYYLGLIHFDKNDAATARQHIEKAQKLGQPPVALKQKLINVGQWRGN